ncbi:hypothetical protein HPB50_008737 [Hyalomma asiaticum]|uniref:Uncharacterized protein n=1 Tax=Hyalomma asiaticum TaxID=266040 RepID=A0ACB7SHR4_HYAAI|nr:hypothetical protein HPB50_008737 [Hyalomma asiaticum]
MTGIRTPTLPQPPVMNEECAYGTEEDERHVESDTRRRRSAQSYQRPATPMSVGQEQHEECRDFSHLGIFMPLYLLPLLFLGPKHGSCLYCILLPLSLWAFNSLPKPATALVHLVTLPLSGLMDTERVARQYLAADILTMVPLMFLVVVMDRWSDVVLSTAQGICARFGLRRGPLFIATCLCSFACSWVFSSAIASAVLMYFLDRVLTTTFKESMDRPRGSAVLWAPSLHRATRESARQLRQIHRRPDESSNKQRPDSHDDQHRIITAGSTSPHSSSLQWLHKLSTFWATVGSKRRADGEAHDGNAPCAESDTRDAALPADRQADHKVSGAGHTLSDTSECPIVMKTTCSLAPSSGAPAATDDDDNNEKRENETPFVFDALADQLDHAAEAFIAAAAGVATELAASIAGGAESEDISVTPATNSTSPAVPAGPAPCTNTPSNRAAHVTALHGAADAAPIHTPAQNTDGDLSKKKESQGDEGSGKPKSKKRSRESTGARNEKKKQAHKCTGSSDRSSRKSSGRSSGLQTPRLLNKNDPRAKDIAPVVVSVVEQERQLKGTSPDPVCSASDIKCPEAKVSEVIDPSVTTSLRRQGVSGQPVSLEHGALKKVQERKMGEPLRPAVPQETVPPGGSTAQPEGEISEAPGSAREAGHDSAQNKGNQLSKSSLRKGRFSNHQRGNLDDNAGSKKGAARTTKAGQQERSAKKNTTYQHVEGSRLTLEPATVQKDQPEGERSGTSGSSSMPVVAEEVSSKVSESSKATAATLVVDRDDSKSTASGTSVGQQQQNDPLAESHQDEVPVPSATVSGLRQRGAALPPATRSGPRRSLQSVVSFEAEVKEIDNKDETTTTAKLTPLAHLVEMAPTSRRKRKRSTIMRNTASGTLAARRVSSVDFGPSQCVVISPTEKMPGSPMPQAQSRLSSASNFLTGDSEAWDMSRWRPIPLRQRMRSRSVPLDEVSLTRSVTSHALSLFGECRRARSHLQP